MAQGVVTPPKDGIEVDVLVAGGGPAGLGAALGAGRQGARTLLAEQMGFLGGVASIGLGMTINQMRPGGLPRSAVHEALIAQLLRYGDAALRIEDHALITNTEYLGWQCLLAEGHRAGYIVPDRMGITPTVYPGSVFVNHSGTKRFGPLDGTDPRDQTKAERIMRQQAVDVVRLLRDRQVPGFEQAYLQQVSPWAGVRETRRIVGEYVLTEDDAKTGARFPDVIARRYGFLDIGFVRYEPMTPRDVPYRALLPQRVENILAAGRIISTTHVAMSAGKSMGNCMATGHAAGVAAALSIGAGVTPRALPVARLQAALRAEGVALDD